MDGENNKTIRSGDPSSRERNGADGDTQQQQADETKPTAAAAAAATTITSMIERSGAAATAPFAAASAEELSPQSFFANDSFSITNQEFSLINAAPSANGGEDDASQEEDPGNEDDTAIEQQQQEDRTKEENETETHSVGDGGSLHETTVDEISEGEDHNDEESSEEETDETDQEDEPWFANPYFKSIRFRCFQNDDQIVRAAQTLSFYMGENSRKMTFDFGEETEQHHNVPFLNWDPLLREIESLQSLQAANILYTPTSRLIHLFRHRFFQALQRNTNIESIAFANTDFTNHSEGIISFLDGAPSNLTKISFSGCEDSSTEKLIATALQRNTSILALTLGACDGSLAHSIFQKLASSDGSTLSCLKKIIFHRLDMPEHHQVWEAMQEYLVSPTATAQCLELKGVHTFSLPSGFKHFAQGLIQSTTVEELIFFHCFLGYDDSSENEDEHEQELAEETEKQLVTLVCSKPNLSTLRVSNCNFFQYSSFAGAIVHLLTQRKSPLRLLEISYDDYDVDFIIPYGEFQSLMTGVANSTRLEHFILGYFSHFDAHQQNHYFRAAMNAIPSFKIKKLTLDFRGRRFESDENRSMFLEAIKSNYCIQSVYFEPIGWLRETNRSRLEFFLYRNRKLAEWVENPKLVPPELWPEALELALKAGKDALYRSLQALSGQGVGSKKRGRKRKWPQRHDPSS